MAFVLANYFNILADEELGDVSKLTNDVPKEAPTSLQESRKQQQQQQQGAAKKKQETKPDAVKMRAKPIFVGKDRVIRKETAMIQTQTPNRKPKFESQTPNQKTKFQTKTPKQETKFEATENHHRQEEVIERKLITLKEFEEQLRGKNMVFNALNKPDGERKVSLDKEFESMKLVGKKNLKDINKLMKLPKSDKDQAKFHKEVDVNGFFKPLIRKERSFTVANEVAEQGGNVIKVDELNIDDLDQFPTLN